MKAFIFFGKAGALAIWALFLINFFGVFPEGVALFLCWAGIFMGLAHIVEYLVFSKQVASKGDSKVYGFFMTFIFGFFYWKF